VVIKQGEIWWADLGEPIGSEPGYWRPVLIVQSAKFNNSGINTTAVVVITSQLRWAASPGNVRLSASMTGLDRDSVANVSQLFTVDQRSLGERIGQVTERKLEQVLDGIELLIGR
jgi:mRNA interferase MazF